MKYNKFGQAVLDSNDIIKLLHKDPNLDITDFILVDPEIYNSSINLLHLDWPKLSKYKEELISVAEFDQAQQSIWYMPDSYQSFDIAAWVLDQAQSEIEFDRLAKELLEFADRNLLQLLRYLKYLVDTMRESNIVWGVGRGSSVASYVLYKIGVHKIDSLKYELDISEFLKD